MLCIGNICRSPIAEAVLQSMAEAEGLDWEIDSAAVRGYHTGSPPHVDSIRICAQHGIDISQQRARLFRASDVEEYDTIYVMAEDVMNEVEEILGQDRIALSRVRFFMAIDPQSETMDLLDPWYGGYDGYEFVYEQIHRRCELLIKAEVERK